MPRLHVEVSETYIRVKGTISTSCGLFVNGMSNNTTCLRFIIDLTTIPSYNFSTQMNYYKLISRTIVVYNAFSCMILDIIFK